jgi:hypothetical protein
MYEDSGLTSGERRAVESDRAYGLGEPGDDGPPTSRRGESVRPRNSEPNV